MKKCVVDTCLVEFEPRKNQKFCDEHSNSKYMQEWRKSHGKGRVQEERTCAALDCDEKFISSNGRQIYCNRDCQLVATGFKKRGVPETGTCLYKDCGKSFTQKKTGPRRKFCDHICRDAHTKQTQAYKNTCEMCENEFQPASSTNRFCDDECEEVDRILTEQRRVEEGRAAGKEVKCARNLCETRFVPRRAVGQDQKYCSPYCSTTDWKNKNPEKVLESGRKHAAKPENKEKQKSYNEKAFGNPVGRMKLLGRSAMNRAKELGLPCDADLVEWLMSNPPGTHCPCCNLPFDFTMNKGRDDRARSPSVDRFLPELGYVRQNLTILCMRCNELKRDANASELKAVYEYVRDGEQKRAALAGVMALVPEIKTEPEIKRNYEWCKGIELHKFLKPVPRMEVV